jgi:membrane-bound serine protease (ClpP class)
MNKSSFTWIILLVFGLFSLTLTGSAITPASAQADVPLVVVLTADGPISPAMAEYLSRGIQTAERRGAEALIVQLNTPGGAITTMNAMVQDILASQVPVIVYVAPRGGMAASAGTLITLAGHAAAMAPGTMIGAASPVGSEGEDLDETMAAKEQNALAATVRALADRRGPEAVALAEATIREASAASANEALEVGLVDFIADDLDDLLIQIDGFPVIIQGKTTNLDTANSEVEYVSVSFIEQLLLILTNPSIVFILLSVGVQAILIEISSPGGWVAGFMGACSLALAAYGIGVLPVNWFGLLFIAIAFVLFILDIKAPTHGGLTAAGVGSLIIGGLVLFNSPSTPSFQRVSVPLVVGVSLFSGVVFFTIMMIAVRAQRAPIRTGQESMAGKWGVTRSPIDPTGSVQVGGELWTAELAEGEAAIPKDVRVLVESAEGIRLKVKRKDR